MVKSYVRYIKTLIKEEFRRIYGTKCIDYCVVTFPYFSTDVGDFAVLLNSGLSMRQAMSMNFLSSLTAFIGGFIGVAMGIEWKASPWIFSITAGLFIYIALVDMVRLGLYYLVDNLRSSLLNFI